MYLKNLSRQIKLRVSEDDFSFLVYFSEKHGISVSQFLRNLIRSARVSSEVGLFFDDDLIDPEDVQYGDTETDKLDIL